MASQEQRDPTRAAQREAIAAKALIETLRSTLGEEDQGLLADMVEGETELMEAIDRILAEQVEERIKIEGIQAVADAMKERQDRAKKRIDTLRTAIEQAMDIAGLSKIARPLATMSLAARAPKLVVETEAEIPALYWKTGDPYLDKKGLTDALKARAAAEALPDGPEREAALTEAPAIPGACLSNGAPSLTLRWK